MIAALSGDKNMLSAFKNNEDIHLKTAAAIFGKSEKDISKDERRAAKTINFGVIYGMGAHSLAEATKMSYGQAQDFISKYFIFFSGVKKYLDNTKKQAGETGYVQTFFGRKRNIAEINSGMSQVRNAAERMAINMPVQGTAADIMKLAMLKVHEAIKTKYLNNCQMLLQVHDELVLEIKEDQVKKITQDLKNIMENIPECEPLGVKFIAEAEVGDNWEDMEKI